MEPLTGRPSARGSNRICVVYGPLCFIAPPSNVKIHDAHRDVGRAGFQQFVELPVPIVLGFLVEDDAPIAALAALVPDAVLDERVEDERLAPGPTAILVARAAQLR